MREQWIYIVYINMYIIYMDILIHSFILLTTLRNDGAFRGEGIREKGKQVRTILQSYKLYLLRFYAHKRFAASPKSVSTCKPATCKNKVSSFKAEHMQWHLENN